MKITIHETKMEFHILPFDEKPNLHELQAASLIKDAMDRDYLCNTLEAAQEIAKFLLEIGQASFCAIELLIWVVADANVNDLDDMSWELADEQIVATLEIEDED